MKIPKLKKGKYKHYKNNKFYEVKDLALHTETEELLVIYKPLYKSDYSLFARPYKVFFERVKHPETRKLVPRFKYVGLKK